MPDIPDVPDPSATEAPQQFGSPERSNLKDRVFEAVEKEIGKDSDSEHFPEPTEPPDRIVAPDGLDEGGGGLWVAVLGILVFLFVLAAVFGVGSVLVLGIAIFLASF